MHNTSTDVVKAALLVYRDIQLAHLSTCQRHLQSAII
jgi:hypothetical protein